MTVFVNGKIWQWDRNEKGELSHHFCDWFQTNEYGVIERVGQSINESSPMDENVIDLQGHLVLPGLHDSHIHALFMGESSEYLDLNGCKSYTEFRNRLKKYDLKYPNKKWIVGYGWEQDLLSGDARYPSRKDIDEVVSTRPVCLYRACWHIAVVNTNALEKAKINVSQRSWDVSDGAVDTDEEGVTGVLRESVSYVFGFY
jgi:predicted amidohydrolase YtcJ